MIGPSAPSYDPSALANARADSRGLDQSRALDRVRPDDAQVNPERKSVLAALSDTGSFLSTATTAVKDTLTGFAKEIRAAFKDFGLGDDALGALVQSLTKPVLDALASGSDFAAQIFVAGVKQVTSVGATSATQSVDMVFKGIEIEFNHSTGELAINQTSVSISQSTTIRTDGNAPMIVDATDGSMNSLADLFEEFNALMKQLAEEMLEAADKDDSSETTLAKPTDAAVIEANDAAAQAAEDPAAGETEAAAGAAESDSARNKLRIHIDLVERFTNARMQQITRVRFDLAMPIAFDPNAAPIAIEAPSGDTPTSGVSISA